MDTRNPSAPSYTQSRHAADPPSNRRRLSPQPRSGYSGLTHDNARHPTRYTVIGNHLAQHTEISGLAIGLAVYIQSLPSGARVDIKTLTARFPEGSTRIAAALRELEAHGYLRRERHRIPGGRIVTRTISCNQPGHHGGGQGVTESDSRPAPVPPESPESPEGPESPVRHAESSERAAPDGSEQPKKRAPGAPRKPLPVVPRPAYPAPALLQAATDLLAGLRRHDPSLLLSACDTAHLAPGVAAWLERDVSPTAVRHALISDLPPEGLRRPAALLAHRLIAQLPPPAPIRPSAPQPPAARRYPLHNCDGCDRAFRTPEPGRCRDCRVTEPTPAGRQT
ncbi:helix-turn-helix domain-containing protein [Streptomyces tauricus]|uniref:helix-turn-helix domain-containing protein n=1 Tax=Streptomyces tauricus TaxID=68274 RepID=UPI00342A6B1D